MKFYNPIASTILNVKKYLSEYCIKELPWLILFFFILLPSELTLGVNRGLDPSWVLGVNLAIQSKLVFGKDFIFTYGPLSFFALKQTIVTNKFVLLCFDLSMLACCVFILREFLKKANYNIFAGIIIAISLFLLRSSGANLMYLLTPLFLFFILFFIHTKNSLYVFIAAIVSIISFYIKVNYGLILVGLLYITLFYSMFTKIIKIKTVVAFIVMHIVLIYIMSRLLNTEIVPYIVSSLHLIDAYNDAMYAPIELTIPLFVNAVVVVLLFVFGFVIKYKSYLNPLVFASYACSALFVFLLFKNGFVRADSHMFEYFKLVVIAFGFMWFFTEGTLKKLWFVLTCAVVCISYYMIFEEILNKKVFKSVVSFNYVSEIFKNVEYENILKDNKKDYQCLIPAQYITEIGTHSVDIIPWDIAELYHYKLKYNPRPVIQSYSAYDEYLDTKNYEKYVSATAPDYIIYSNKTIDTRNAFWDESITKRAMLTHYELMDTASIFEMNNTFDENRYLKKYPDVKEAIQKGYLKSGYEHYQLYGKDEDRESCQDVLLLKKRATPLTLTLLKEKKVTMEIGKEYSIDSSENLQYLYADVKYNISGKGRRFLFQPPALYVVFTYDNGITATRKAIVPILKTGVLLNKKVNTTCAAGLFFHSGGKQNANVKSIKFIAESGFNPIIESTIKEMRLEP